MGALSKLMACTRDTREAFAALAGSTSDPLTRAFCLCWVRDCDDRLRVLARHVVGLV